VRLLSSVLLIAVTLVAVTCSRRPAASKSSTPEVAASPAASAVPELTPWQPPKLSSKPKREFLATATWYKVPRDSIPALRAYPGELTAAHDTLPLGSYVRVTDLRSKKAVVVRITDRGVGRRSVIDLCERAAAEIGLIGRGVARVRLSVLETVDENLPVPTGSVLN
jgi:rare lipoprotein A